MLSFKKHRVFDTYNTYNIVHKWFGHIPNVMAKEIIDCFVIGANYWYESFHGSLSHEIQRALICLMFNDDGKLQLEYVENEETKKITIRDIFENLINLKTTLNNNEYLLFDIVLDTGNPEKPSFRFPYYLNSFMMHKGEEWGIGEFSSCLIDLHIGAFEKSVGILKEIALILKWI